MLRGDDIIDPDITEEQIKEAVRFLLGQSVAHSDLPYTGKRLAEGGNARVRAAGWRSHPIPGTARQALRFLRTLSDL